MTAPTWWPLVDDADAGGAGAARSSYGRGRHVDRWGELADGFNVVARIWFPNGTIAEVVPISFGRARLALVDLSMRESYEDVWCYASPALALAAAKGWDGREDSEPIGWHRHPQTGRRRENGDPAREEIRE